MFVAKLYPYFYDSRIGRSIKRMTTSTIHFHSGCLERFLLPARGATSKDAWKSSAKRLSRRASRRMVITSRRNRKISITPFRLVNSRWESSCVRWTRLEQPWLRIICLAHKNLFLHPRIECCINISTSLFIYFWKMNSILRNPFFARAILMYFIID